MRDLKSRFQSTYDLAIKSAAKVGERNKSHFDNHVLESSLEIRHRVLVKKKKKVDCGNPFQSEMYGWMCMYGAFNNTILLTHTYVLILVQPNRRKQCSLFKCATITI